MPKGDRHILKADTEDGHTPIANLLLEAVAIAPLSGVERGAVVALLRMTYGWADGNRRRTEAVISHADWARFLNTNPVYAARVVKKLVIKKVLNRSDLGKGKGYCYSMNTRVNQWVGGKLNGLELNERFRVPPTKRFRVPPTKRFRVPPTKRFRVPPTKQFTPPVTKTASPKEKEIKEKENSSGYRDKNNEILVAYRQEIGDATPRVISQIDEALQHYPTDWIMEAIKKAVLQNRRHWGYVEGVLENWKRDEMTTHVKNSADKYINQKYAHMVHR